MSELSPFLRICICTFLCFTGLMNQVNAQENKAYFSWNDYRKANGRLLGDSLILKKRTIGEIMAYKGNDYEFLILITASISMIVSPFVIRVSIIFKARR